MVSVLTVEIKRKLRILSLRKLSLTHCAIFKLLHLHKVSCMCIVRSLKSEYIEKLNMCRNA